MLTQQSTPTATGTTVTWFYLHWVDAHCGIDQNELADKQAGLGSKDAVAQQDAAYVFQRFSRSNANFLSLTQLVDYPSLNDILGLYDG